MWQNIYSKLGLQYQPAVNGNQHADCISTKLPPIGRLVHTIDPPTPDGCGARDEGDLTHLGAQATLCIL